MYCILFIMLQHTPLFLNPAELPFSAKETCLGFPRTWWSLDGIIFFYIRQYNPLKVNRCFVGRVVHASYCFLIWLTPGSWRWRRYVPPKCQMTFTGLQGVVSQKVYIHVWDNIRSNTIMDIRVPQMSENFLNNWATISLSKRTLFPGFN
jgi:hypothetical protein